jgi:hypothetical protein
LGLISNGSSPKRKIRNHLRNSSPNSGPKSLLAVDLSSGIHKGASVSGYIWNTLILGNHELALISQWMIGVPVLTSLAYSFGAWLDKSPYRSLRVLSVNAPGFANYAAAIS